MSKPLYCSSITDLPRCVDHSLPEVPFDIMVELAAVTMPFEYPAGLLLTGFKTLLMATAIWMDKIEFTHYIENEEYDFCGAAPTFEDAASSRTFIGWADNYDLQFSRANRDNVKTANLARASDHLKFKEITASAAFGKSPATVSIGCNFEWVKPDIGGSINP